MKLKYQKLSTLLLAFFVFSAVYSQQINTMYFMEPVPQRNELNPAFQPSCIDLYVGVPVLSTIQVYAGNTSLPVFKIIGKNSNTNQIGNLLQPKDSSGGFGSNYGDVSSYLKQQNLFFTNVQINLLSFGYREDKDLFFTFSLASKVNANIGVNKDLFGLILNTDTIPFRSYNLWGSGVELTAYKELSFGISKKVSDNFTHGGRIKILFGDANLSLRVSKCSFTADTMSGAYVANTNIKLNGSIPFTNVFFTPMGFVNTNTTQFDSATTLLNYILNLKNPGLAIDYGFVYKPIEDLSLSGSVIDLGFIHWGTNVFNETLNKIQMKIPQNQGSAAPNFDPSHVYNYIAANYPADTSRNSYFSWLSAKIYLGASYYIRRDLSLGLLSRTEIFRSHFYEQMVVSANYYPIKNVAGTLSYSFVNNGMTSIGAGVNFRLGAFNLYLITDNIPFYYTKQFEPEISKPMPDMVKALDIRIGINVALGCKKIRDIPSCE